MGEFTDSGAKADAKIAALQNMVDNQAVVIDGLDAQNKKLAADLKACQDSKPPVPPTPTPTQTIVGSNTGGSGSPSDFEAYATRCGGLEVVRSFLSPGQVPATLASTSAKSSIDKRYIVLSAKGRTASIDDACDSIIAGKDDLWISGLLRGLRNSKKKGAFIVRHEPDEEKPTITKWHGAQKHVRTLVDAVNAEPGTADPVLFGACLMTWSTNEVPDRIKDFYPGDGVWDFISWDGYSDTAPWNTSGQIFDKALAWNKAHGNLPFAISEFGAGGSLTSDRSKFIKDVCDYAKAHDALWVCYWNAKGAKADYRLSPSDEKALGAQS